MSHFVKSVENSGTLFNTNDEDNDDINNEGNYVGFKMYQTMIQTL